MLHDWLLRPHVAQWWGEAESAAALRSHYLLMAGQANATRAYVVSFATTPIGFIQSYVVLGSGGGWWENELDPVRISAIVDAEIRLIVDGVSA